ncbi:MAG: hypothetical protein D6725_07355 [Planctomycetota bacterium]|nr:MAG: hypothetical protein D6725_07355 [Planctomycetota bacterium]
MDGRLKRMGIPVAVVTCWAWCVGCGGGGEAVPEALDAPADALKPAAEKTAVGPSARPQSREGQAVQPVNAVASGAAASPAQSGEDEPEPGSAEWILREIRLLRVKPFPDTLTAEQLREAHRERNRKIVQLATEAIALTHRDKEKENLFTLAVVDLMEAEFQLAMMGEQASVDALYDHAQALYERDPHSKAAAEAAYKVAYFAFKNAERFGHEEPRWLEEFARQARLFADNFPEEQKRAAMLLSAAAFTCELHRLIEHAIACYAQLAQQFPDHPAAKGAVAALRRLQLPGKKLELAGPSLDGGFLQADQFRGRVLVVVFWASFARPFQDDLPKLRALQQRFAGQPFSLLGVNLDDDDVALEQFLRNHRLQWPQIRFPESGQQGWNNPIAVHYGVRTVPQYWVIRPDGTVHTTTARADELDAIIARLLN